MQILVTLPYKHSPDILKSRNWTLTNFVNKFGLFCFSLSKYQANIWVVAPSQASNPSSYTTKIVCSYPTSWFFCCCCCCLLSFPEPSRNVALRINLDLLIRFDCVVPKLLIPKWIHRAWFLMQITWWSLIYKLKFEPSAPQGSGWEKCGIKRRELFKRKCSNQENSCPSSWYRVR